MVRNSHSDDCDSGKRLNIRADKSVSLLLQLKLPFTTNNSAVPFPFYILLASLLAGFSIGFS